MSTTTYTEKYNLSCVKSGDTWPGMSIGFNMDITLWQIHMDVYRVGSDTPVLQFSTEGVAPGIEKGVEDEGIWPATWAPKDIALAANTYRYKIYVIKPGPVKRTYIEGTWLIT